MPQKRSQKAKFQNFDFTRLLCQSALRQRFRTDFILDFKGPSSDPPSHLRAIPKNFGSRPPWARRNPQKLFPNFSNLRGGGKFSSALHGELHGPPGIKFWQLYHGPLPRVTKISHMPKNVATMLPKSGTKYTPSGSTSEIFRAKKRFSSWTHALGLQ